MKREFRICAAFLALLTCVTAFAACGKPAESVETTATAAVVQADTTAAPETTDKYELGDELPELNYNDAEVVIISRGRNWVEDEVSVAEDTGDPIDSAIWKRNLNVEDRLHVKIVNTMVPGTDNYEIAAMLDKQVVGGLDDYDLACCSVYASIIDTYKNLYYDLTDLQYLDLSRPYWSQGFNEAASFTNSQFFATGAICLSLYRFIFATFFNRNLFESKGVEFPYKAVQDHKWTIEYQYELSQGFYDDVNGNNQKDESDVFGFISNADMIGVDSYWSAFKLPILVKTPENKMEYSLDIERSTDAVTKLNKMFWDNVASYAVPNSSGDGDQLVIARLFGEGKGAMCTLRLIEVEGEYLRNMTDDRGVIPMPMLDENQDDYCSYAHDTMSAYALPNTGKSEDDLDMLGAVMEAMCSESYKYVLPAYYELTLKSKYIDDSDSIEMLDIIVNNLYIDPGVLYTKSINSVHQQMRTLVGGNLGTAAAMFKSNSKVVPKLVDKLNEGIDGVITK